MAHLVNEQAKEQAEIAEVKFENLLFASNFPLWKELYGKEKQKIEEELEWVTPDSEGFADMLDEMRSLGLEV